MHTVLLGSTAAMLAAWANGAAAQPDARLQEAWYDPRAVITVPVKRGVVTHIVLDPDESIIEIGSGLGADCSKPESSWCIAAQPGGRNIFVKPKSSAGRPNNLAVVTDRRTHALRFELLSDDDRRAPVYRLSIKAPSTKVAVPMPPKPAAPEVTEQTPPAASTAPAPNEAVVAERLDAAPEVVNWNYSIAEGAGSADIVPTLIFDDGRFTYFRFSNNREVPAAFHVLGDGTETLVNTRMEGEFLVVDRVSRRLVLRAGSAVVGIWNEAFDADGVPPKEGTTAPGVRRELKPGGDAPRDKEPTHGSAP